MKRFLSHIYSTPMSLAATGLLIGVYIGRFSHSISLVLSVALIGIIALAVRAFPEFIAEPIRRIKLKFMLRHSILLFYFVCFLLLGNLLISFSEHDVSSLDYSQYAEGVVTDILSTTSGDVLTVEADRFYTDLNRPITHQQLTIKVYTDATALCLGDIIKFRLNFQSISPEAYNYSYLYAHNIAGYSDTPVDFIQVIGKDNSLRTCALTIRDKISMFIDRTNLNNDTKGFINAMMTGDRTELNVEHREKFRTAGIAHILSLSGLHVGIIVLIINSLLLPLNLINMRNVRYVMIGVGALMFAFITGMNPPVVRAAIMTVFLAGSQILQRKHSSINALSGAACLILIFQPRSAFDISFQLSFICTVAIIVAVKFINERFKYGYLQKVLILCAIPISATIISWPVSVYTFHTFSTLFLPLNILAVPLLPLYIILAIIFMVMSGAGFEISWLIYLLDKGYSLLATGVGMVSVTGADITGIHLSVTVVVVGVIAGMTLLYALRSKGRRDYITAGLSYIILAVAIFVIPAESQATHIEIPSDYYGLQLKTSYEGETTYQLIKDGDAATTYAADCTIQYIDCDVKDNYKLLTMLTANATNKCPAGAIAHDGLSVIKPQDINAGGDEKITKLVVIGCNFHGDIDTVLQVLQPNQVLISARVYPNVTEKIEEACKNQNIKIHYLSDDKFILK